MNMKKLFVVDTDKNFQTQVNSLCPPHQVEVQFYSSGMEIFSLIAKEKPYLVLVNLDVPDINDFFMYDLLKRTNDNSIPVVVTYSNQTEQELQPYKKLKFQAKGYYKKPISNDDLYGLLENYLELQEEDDDVNEFTDANIDRLVQGDPLEQGPKDEFNAAELLDDLVDEPAIEADTKELEVDEQKKKTSGMEIELKNQIISLERQNESLKSENKELTNAVQSLKADMEKQGLQVQQLKSQLQEKTAEHEAVVGPFEEQLAALKNYADGLENQYSELTQQFQTKEKENSLLQGQVNQLTTQLTDKERELAAKNHEIEKLTGERKQIQSSQNNELENIKQSTSQLRNENEELRKRVDSLNRTISTLAEEKVSLSDVVASMEEKISQHQQEMEEKEKHLTTLKDQNRDMDEARNELNFYKNRLQELGELLHNALALTQTGNQP